MKDTFRSIINKLPLGLLYATALVIGGLLLVLLGLDIRLGAIQRGPNTPLIPLLVIAGILIIAGLVLGLVTALKPQRARQVTAEDTAPTVICFDGNPQVVYHILQLVKQREQDYFREFLISLELSNYVGELLLDRPPGPRDPELAANLGHVEWYLDQALHMPHSERFRCNAIELVGNVGIIWRTDTRRRQEWIVKLNTLLKDTKEQRQWYAHELAHLKLLLFDADRTRAEELIRRLTIGADKGTYKRSFYQLGTMEDPITSIHHILRHPAYGYARAYAAALLPLLVAEDDKQKLRLEVHSALGFAQRQQGDEYALLVDVLKQIRGDLG